MREKGVASFSASFEAQSALPLDARQRVETVADLVLPETWTANDNNIYLYPGFFTYVFNDPNPDNNGLYALKQLPFTIPSNWIKLTSNLTPPGREKIDLCFSGNYICTGYLHSNTRGYSSRINAYYFHNSGEIQSIFCQVDAPVPSKTISIVDNNDQILYTFPITESTIFLNNLQIDVLPQTSISVFVQGPGVLKSIYIQLHAILT